MKINISHFFVAVCACLVGMLPDTCFADDTCNGNIVNNECVSLGEYYDTETSTVTRCPDFYDPEETSGLYQYFQGTSVKGIESCMIKLNTDLSSCSDETNVIYVYNSSSEGFVRQPNYRVEADILSVVVDETDQTRYPGNIIKPNNGTVTKDYCVQCGTINGNQLYNVNGTCGFCNGGHCVDRSSDICSVCPAGYECPGNDDDQNSEVKNLYCDRITACDKDEYSESGARACGKCALGYSTYYSSPADGTCLSKSRPNNNGQAYGIKCTSAAACKLIPPQFCHKPNCACTSEDGEISDSGGIVNRDKCKSSFALGNNVTFGTINTKVVQQVEKKPKYKNTALLSH